MKYIKSFVLLFLLLLLTGCTVNYNLDVDTNFTENIIINSNIPTKEIPLYIDDYNITYEATEKLDNYKYYSLIKNGNITNYSATFKSSEFSKVTSCGLLFDKCEFINVGGGKSVISTTTGTGVFYDYPEIDVININLNINGDVITSNADSVNNNVYTWRITPENASEKKIYVEFTGKFKGSNDVKTSGKSEKEKNKENLIYLSILLGALIALFVALLVLQKKKYKQ